MLLIIIQTIILSSYRSVINLYRLAKIMSNDAIMINKFFVKLKVVFHLYKIIIIISLMQGLQPLKVIYPYKCNTITTLTFLENVYDENSHSNDKHQNKT